MQMTVDGDEGFERAKPSCHLHTKRGVLEPDGSAMEMRFRHFCGCHGL